MYGKFTKLRVLTIHPVDVHSHFIVSLTNVLKEFRDAVFNLMEMKPIKVGTRIRLLRFMFLPVF